MLFREDVGDPLQFPTHVPAFLYRVSFWGRRLLNFPFSCKVVEKRGF